MRQNHLRRKYGISIEQYDEMLRRQGGVCAICRGKQNAKWKHFDVDHDKATGRVRGLLCRRCNTGLGYLENSTFSGKAKAYLDGGVLPSL